ncbi:MAG TPA: ABC transporter permease [Candidatus Limnocylindrales bacterium]
MTTVAEARRSLPRRIWAIGGLPFISIVLALVVGAVVILVSELLLPDHVFDWTLPITAYLALIEGSLGSPDNVIKTFVASVPLVLAGLSVALGFKAGLFNIGAQGQFLVGALGAVTVGVAFGQAPGLVAIPMAVLAGLLAGAAWGFIPGVLKAVSGAHEVVTTIMLNYVAISLLAWAVSGPLKVVGSPSPITHDVGNAAFPILIGTTGHLGIFIALAMVVAVRWLLYKTTLGFEIRTVGANPDAARYAGMRPKVLIVLTMSMCGLLAGLAGACIVLGVTHSMTSAFGTTVGFDAIAVALLARSNPVGIIFSGLLFGAMRAGAGLMQINAKIPPELIDVIQALILLFLVIGPVLTRVLKLRGVSGSLGATETITKSYASESAP